MIIGNPASAWGRAGLHTHDRLVSVNGQLMTTWPDVRALLTTARIGDTLRFEVARPIGVFPVSVVLSGYEQPVVRISELPDASARQRAVRAGWLAHARALTPNADQD
jgi:predicted metalloprotease with PDZ domain